MTSYRNWHKWFPGTRKYNKFSFKLNWILFWYRFQCFSVDEMVSLESIRTCCLTVRRIPTNWLMSQCPNVPINSCLVVRKEKWDCWGRQKNHSALGCVRLFELCYNVTGDGCTAFRCSLYAQWDQFGGRMYSRISVICKLSWFTKSWKQWLE